MKNQTEADRGALSTVAHRENQELLKINQETELLTDNRGST